MTDLKRRILARVDRDLAEIEQALKDNLNPYLDLVTQVASHILFSGGKRLRPLLMVLSARICGYAGDYDKPFSTSLEYLHTATLLHDDLVDGASLRRGRPVAHTQWDNSIVVLVGDFLLARALSISAGTDNVKIIKVLAKLTEDMSQGEVHQLMRKGDVDLKESEYLEVITRKTAVLFEAACRTSAMLAGAPSEKETALATYGFNLGIAFQMADDLFDYTLDTRSLGKEVGTDLREGKLTLPVIYALKQADPQDRNQMVATIRDTDFSVEQFEALVELLKKYGGVSYAEREAAAYIGKAKAALSVFEPSETRDVLLDVADYALARRV
jgi:octaprenyl-diphosphate synthase